MVSYLKASNEQRKLMEAAMPDIFTPDVVEELSSADDLLRDSTAAARDALSCGNSVFREVGVVRSVAPPSTAAERGIDLEDVEEEGSAAGDTFDEDDLAGDGLGTFEEILAQLMAKQEEATALVPREPRPAEEGCGGAEKADMGSLVSSDARARLGCVVLPSLLLNEVFSFLPILDVIEITEHVCNYWNRVTTASVTAQAFWIGCVHREYPSQLAALVASEGPSLFEADWRTIATVIVCNELAEDGDGEDD